MTHTIFQQVRTSFLMLIFFTVLTGIIYTSVITFLSQLLFEEQANGSLITANGEIIGSRFIGQQFSDQKYFWGRPSATSGFPYNTDLPSSSNLGPTNPKLLEDIKLRIAYLKKSHAMEEIPINLITASGSGLDPEISKESAYYQISRVAKSRNLKEDAVTQLVDEHTTGRQFGFLGEIRVNVLLLNLDLDRMEQKHGR